jgi:DNA-binding transcriptional LysR family regulator
VNSADLRVFEAVARHGSITKAARELGTVQSNVTARIRSLEGEIGRALFFRRPRGVSLTRAGESLLPYASRVGRLLVDAQRALDDRTPSGALVVGTMETTAAVRMPPVLLRYRRRYPDVDLTLRTGPTVNLVEDVVAFRLEGAFVAGPVGHPDLEEEEVFEEDLVLLSAPERTDLKAALRCDGVVAFRTGCSYRRRLEDFLGEREKRPRRRLELGTVEGILGCVAADLGITMLPRAVAERAARGTLKMHVLPRRYSHVPTVFVRRGDALISSALREFVKCAKERAANSRDGSSKADDRS